MPKTIFMIRHGEKPEDESDVHLSSKGYQRAGALSALFNANHNGGAYPPIDAVFATAYSKKSHRPVLTIKPLAAVLGLDINDAFADKQCVALAAALAVENFAGKVVLICWHHGEIPELAGALNATEVPSKWPENRFDLIWRLDYDRGEPTVKILPQLLLYGDNPVGGSS
jgi:hypothetical protein